MSRVFPLFTSHSFSHAYKWRQSRALGTKTFKSIVYGTNGHSPGLGDSQKNKQTKGESDMQTNAMNHMWQPKVALYFMPQNSESPV